MKRMRYAAAFSALALTALLAGCGNKETKSGAVPETETVQTAEKEGGMPEETETKNGALFGEFVSYTQQGEEVTQEIFAEADLTMVNIWGTFCGPCISEMPDLAELAEEYRDKGLQVIGIICDVAEAGDADAQEIIDLTGAAYTHIVLSQELYENFLYQVQAVLPPPSWTGRESRWETW